MTQAARREYQRKWRARPRRCECGQPATVPNHGGKICQRCADLEYKRKLRESWRERHEQLFGGLSEFRLAGDRRTKVRHYGN